MARREPAKRAGITTAGWQRHYAAAEKQFALLVQRAVRLSNRASSRLDGPDMNPEEFPGYTLLRMHMEARIQFASALQLLGDQWLTYGADAHVRPLLEALAHTAWLLGVTDGAPNDVAPCRALCVELGWLRMRNFNTLKISKVAQDDVEDSIVDRARRELAVLERLHHEQGCRCRARGPGQVRQSLQALAARQALPPWFADLYDLYSQSLHLQTPERFVRAAGTGRTFMPSTFQQRAYTLTWTLFCYGHIAGWTVRNIAGEKAAAPIDAAITTIIDNDWLSRARDGWVDHLMGYPKPTFPRSYYAPGSSSAEI